MKKRYLILAGLLTAAVLFAAGCGKKEEEEQKGDAAQVTAAPVQDTGGEDTSGGLVEMQKSSDENIKNVLGEKTSAASKIVLINSTGSDVAQIYIRPHEDGDQWGSELVQGSFVLKNGEKALYYLDKTVKDSQGNTPVSYDIRIAYTDAYRSECFFRMIPLQNVTQITLRMDGTGEAAIPYATYLSGSSQQETSTLNEVKQRLGLSYDYEESQQQEDVEEEISPTPVLEVTEAPTPTPAPEEDPVDTDTEPTSNASETAKSYIGQPLGSLIGACGSPSGSDYENEPETGETGYHYYDTFTVSTTVDENGNEIVAGVW